MAKLEKDAGVVEVKYIEGQPVVGKLTVKALLHTDRALMLEVKMTRGTATPPHWHNHDSLCYMLSGRVKSTVGGDDTELGPGEACLHPKGTDHCVEALDDSAWIEVKMPAPERLEEMFR